ncbi:hypothetical protein C8Q75DRAFT_887548 [Abortiporus biennis]|nr:hypothetical protein C8Q75DRAFT_887548 [Abortiporus biennis]
MAPKRSSTRQQRLSDAKKDVPRLRQRRPNPPKIRTVPPFPKYCDELERDKDGNTTYNAETGYKLTSRGEVACKKRLRIWTKCHPPFTKLPSEYIPNNNSSTECPFLLWGIPFSHEQALDYAARHNLRKVSDDMLPLFIVTDLDSLHWHRIRLRVPSQPQASEREARIVKAIKRELKSDFEPMWWWDRSRNEIRQDAPCQKDLFPNIVYKGKDF